MTIKQAHDFFLQIHVTSRCNLRCEHCYQDGTNSAEMTFEQIVESVDEVASTLDVWSDSYGIEFDRSANVTGGEPFYRDDLMDILRHIKNRGFDIYLLTNGTQVDNGRAEELSDVGIAGVQVSIEGPEEVHDSIRGKGSYTEAMKGVKALLAAGHSVALNMTLSTLNAGHFMQMADIASNMGVHRFGFSRIVPYGSGEKLSQNMLTTREVHELYEEISKLKFENMRIVTGDPVASCLLFPEATGATGKVPVGGCSAGLSGITFMPDGTILPCRRLDVPLGNILADSFREIWATSPVLQDLRDKSLYPGKCGTCAIWASCRGCRAIAYANTLLAGEGDYLADDPQCFHSFPESSGD